MTYARRNASLNPIYTSAKMTPNNDKVARQPTKRSHLINMIEPSHMVRGTDRSNPTFGPLLEFVKGITKNVILRCMLGNPVT